jgi:rhodanese-related sulfurtransferase
MPTEAPKRSLRPLYAALAACVLVGAVSAALALKSPPNMDGMMQQVRQKFPDVKQLSTQQLELWLIRDTNAPVPVILDARDEEEYAVSHLPDSRRVDPDEPAENLADVPKERPVVVYCSVGYRSSMAAQKLSKAGFKEVYNLEGSIFQWANEGRRLEANGKPAKTVHPYDEKWGQLLKPELREKIATKKE